MHFFSDRVRRAWRMLTLIGSAAFDVVIILTVPVLLFAFVNFSSEPPPEFTSAWLQALYIISIMCMPLYFALLVADRFTDNNEKETWSGLFIQLNILFIAVAALPMTLARLTYLLQINLFADSCGNPRMLDFTWFVLDALAKGSLLDFLESFDIDINTCAPRKPSWATSTIIFLVRSFSTYILIWSILKVVKLVRTLVPVFQAQGSKGDDKFSSALVFVIVATVQSLVGGAFIQVLQHNFGSLSERTTLIVVVANALIGLFAWAFILAGAKYNSFRLAARAGATFVSPFVIALVLTVFSRWLLSSHITAFGALAEGAAIAALAAGWYAASALVVRQIFR